jgi:hypothetical protein
MAKGGGVGKFKVGDHVSYKNNFTGIKYSGEVIEIDSDGKYLKVRNTIGNIDYLPTSEVKKMANGGGVGEDLDEVYYYAMHRWESLDNSTCLKAQEQLNINPKGIKRVLSWDEIKDSDKLKIHEWMNNNLDEDNFYKYAKGGNIKTKTKTTMDKKWSKKIDKAIKAKKPGFRKSPGGGYYEYRSNRSDVNPKMKLEWGGTAESSETGEPIGGENQSSMFSEGGNIGGFTYSIGGL